MSRIQYSPDFDTAIKNSKSRKAISDPLEIYIPNRQDRIKVCIVIDSYHVAQYVYSSCIGIKVKGVDAPKAHDVDRVRRWKPW